MTADRITIVAEAAQGFEGDPSLARLLARAAGRAGADIVKFQLVYADELATPTYRYYDLFRRLEMPDDAWEVVRAEAEHSQVGLAFDVFGPRSLNLALKLGARAVKIHSTDFFNDQLLEGALVRAPEVYVSVGGISVEEVAAFMGRCGTRAAKLVLLLGYQAEPTPLADTHVARLAAWRTRFPDVRLGYMDHADGAADEAEWLGLLAVPFGVTVLEKHLSLDRTLELEDHVSALGPETFRRFVSRIRAAETAMGSPDLALTEAERGYRGRALKVVVAAEPLAAGATITAGALTLLRAPLESGREPLRRLADAVGRRAVHAVARMTSLSEGDVR